MLPLHPTGTPPSPHFPLSYGTFIRRLHDPIITGMHTAEYMGGEGSALPPCCPAALLPCCAHLRTPECALRQAPGANTPPAGIQERVALWTKLNISHQEDMQVLRYGYSQQYKARVQGQTGLLGMGWGGAKGGRGEEGREGSP